MADACLGKAGTAISSMGDFRPSVVVRQLQVHKQRTDGQIASCVPLATLSPTQLSENVDKCCNGRAVEVLWERRGASLDVTTSQENPQQISLNCSQWTL